MHRRFASVSLIIALATLAAAGCRPEVGDGCISDVECDRPQTCDTTSPGGYCTIYECAPGDCPAEAVCVEFASGEEQEIVTRACMRRCAEDKDCRDRDGYVCRLDEAASGFCGLTPR